MVGDMEVDMVADMEVDKVADMEMDKVALQCSFMLFYREKMFFTHFGPFCCKIKMSWEYK